MSDDNNKQHISPSGLVHDTIDALKTAKSDHLLAADEIDHSIRYLIAGTPYWDNADPARFYTSPSGGTAIAYLQSLRGQAMALRDSAGDGLEEAITFNSTGTAYGAVTNTAHAVVHLVEGFNPGHLLEVVDRAEREEEYARKFEAFDAELGRLYHQVLEVRSRTTSHPAKSVLPDIRQAYDHLMRKLAPDGEVRSQKNWQPIDPNKPKMVTRRQRLEYAIEKHVSEPCHKATLLASAEHALTVHDELSELYHTEDPIDVEKARAAAQAMLEVLNQWSDALEL